MLEAEAILHVVEVRNAVEIEAARLAAQRRDAVDVAALRQALDGRTAAAHSGDAAFVDADIAVHRAVVDAAHNPVLSELFETFVPRLRAALIELIAVLDLHPHQPARCGRASNVGGRHRSRRRGGSRTDQPGAPRRHGGSVATLDARLFAAFELEVHLEVFVVGCTERHKEDEPSHQCDDNETDYPINDYPLLRPAPRWSRQRSALWRVRVRRRRNRPARVEYCPPLLPP